MALRLKATKTSLYNLVGAFAQLPKMRRTEFKKAFRSPDYWLEWYADGTEYRAFFAAGWGTALLAIESKEYDDASGDYRHTREVHKVSLDELRERDLVEEYTPRNAHPA